LIGERFGKLLRDFQTTHFHGLNIRDRRSCRCGSGRRSLLRSGGQDSSEDKQNKPCQQL